MKRLLLYPCAFIVLVLLTGTCCRAQDSATSRFLDTVRFQHDSFAVAAPVVDSESVETTTDPEEAMPVDTAITFNIRSIAADTMRSIRTDKGFYYQGWLDSLMRAEDRTMAPLTVEPTPARRPSLDIFFDLFQIGLWILAAAFLLFIIYKLFIGKYGILHANRKNLDETIDAGKADSMAGGYESLAAQAETANDFRLAIRFRYLHLLDRLAELNFVQPAADKTNYQYLQELRRKAPAYASAFSALTHTYEYSWYGEYPVAHDRYTGIKTLFADLHQSLN